MLEIPFSQAVIQNAVLSSLSANHLEEGYIRPLVFLGDGSMGLLPSDNPVHVAIVVWPWGAYLGEENLERGVRAKISSYMRPHPNSSMTKSKGKPS